MPASERPQSTEAGRPQGMLGHPQHPPTEHARQARCSQCGASASPTATHPTTTGPSCPCVTGGGAEVPGATGGLCSLAALMVRPTGTSGLTDAEAGAAAAASRGAGAHVRCLQAPPRPC